MSIDHHSEGQKLIWCKVEKFSVATQFLYFGIVFDCKELMICFLSLKSLFFLPIRILLTLTGDF